MTYFVYLLQCADKSFYCGYTTELERRVAEHNHSDKGSKYTRSKRPVELVYSEEYQTLSEALKREHQIKQLSSQEKRTLVHRERNH